MQKVNEQRKNTREGGTNIVQEQVPKEAFDRLAKKYSEVQAKAAKTTRKYWNARRRILRIEKVSTARKVNLVKARAEAAQLRGITSMIGKKLEDLKNTSDETTTRLQVRIRL